MNLITCNFNITFYSCYSYLWQKKISKIKHPTNVNVWVTIWIRQSSMLLNSEYRETLSSTFLILDFSIIEIKFCSYVFPTYSLQHYSYIYMKISKYSICQKEVLSGHEMWFFLHFSLLGGKVCVFLHDRPLVFMAKIFFLANA